MVNSGDSCYDLIADTPAWFNDIQEIIDSLYSFSEKDNLNTKQKVDLFTKIETLTNIIKDSPGSLNNLTHNVRSLACDLVIREFERHGIGETERLAKKIAQNSLCTNAAYIPLHELFKFIAYQKGHSRKEISKIFSRSNPDAFKFYPGLNTLQWIDFAVKDYVDRGIAEAAKKVPEIPREIEELIATSLNCRLVSKNYKEAYDKNGLIFNYERLPDESQKSINSFDDLLKFLGKENCQKIIELHSIPRNLIFLSSKSNIQKIKDNFPKLKYISLELNNIEWFRVFLTDFPWDTDLRSFKKVDTLNLCNCTAIKKFKCLEKFEKLKNLNISGCTQITDFTFLSRICLYALDISNCTQITDLTFLPPSAFGLLVLNISGCTQIADFTFLTKFPKLQELTISADLQIPEYVINELKNKKILIIQASLSDESHYDRA